MVDSTNLPNVDINAIATDLNNKMDRDGVNASCPTLLSRTTNSYDGVVEIWSDGYCVQNGYATVNDLAAVNLSQEYINTNYTVILTVKYNATSAGFAQVGILYTDRFTLDRNDASSGVYWETRGYIR